MEPLIFAIGDKKPVIHETAFIAPGVVIASDVEVHEPAPVWDGSVLRGDTSGFEKMNAVYERCHQHPTLEKAHPLNQPDAPEQ